MFGLEHKVEKAARTAVAFSVGGVLTMIGAGFLTAAGFMLLSELRSPLFATTVIGAIYTGLGLIVIASGTAKRDSKPAPQTPKGTDALSPMQLVAVSFIQGIEEGRRSKRST